MMNRKRLFAAFLSLVLAAGVTASAWAEIFQRTIMLGPGAGQFTIGDLGIGDTVVLTLVNPTNRPLVFETTQNLGNEKSWTVPANSRTTVDFTYTRPFDDDVEFVVRDISPTSPAIAQGTLVPARMGERPAAFTTTPPREIQPSQRMAPTERPAAYTRGYW